MKFHAAAAEVTAASARHTLANRLHLAHDGRLPSHPVMQRFHRPGEEKRMVVILHPGDYARWLACPVAEAPGFFRQWQGSLEAGPAPLPPRAPKSSSVRTSRPAPTTGDLF